MICLGAEASGGQLPSCKVHYGSGKAPRACVAASGPKLSISLLWSPVHI